MPKNFVPLGCHKMVNNLKIDRDPKEEIAFFGFTLLLQQLHTTQTPFSPNLQALNQFLTQCFNLGHAVKDSRMIIMVIFEKSKDGASWT